MSTNEREREARLIPTISAPMSVTATHSHHVAYADKKTAQTVQTEREGTNFNVSIFHDTR
jgi:hypothetical protein